MNYSLEDFVKIEDEIRSKTFPIVEMFGPTIQGEGAMIGEQTMFIRIGGCDYRCERCDSLHAVLPDLIKMNSERMTQSEMVDGILTMMGSTEWITLSGGNPCMYDISRFVATMRHVYKKKIAVETQGTIWQDWLLDCSHVTISPKGPGMGERFEPDKFDVFMSKLYKNFCVKVVIFDQQDMEFAIELMDRWPSIKDRMFLSIGNVLPPMPAKRNYSQESTVDRDTLVHQMLESYRIIASDVMQDPRLSTVRILPQLHCLLWGNDQGR